MFKSNKIADKKMMKLAKKINKRLYDNDIENPRGGIRGVIPNKKDY